MREINDNFSEKDRKNQITKTKYLFSQIEWQIDKVINEWISENDILIIDIIPIKVGAVLIHYKEK